MICPVVLAHENVRFVEAAWEEDARGETRMRDYPRAAVERVINPLSHSLDGGGPSALNRTFRVLRKPDILICRQPRS
jgi:hypothetical protein